MWRQRWFLVILTLACFPASPARAQLLSDPGSLSHTLDVQIQWAEGLGSARRDAALRFLAVAEAILALPDEPGSERSGLLLEAQGLSDRMASLEEERAQAAAMVRETRGRLIGALESRLASLRQAAQGALSPQRQTLEDQAREFEGELTALRVAQGAADAADPLEAATATLAALAGVVADELERLRALGGLQEELRIFMGSLRLFDETSMPPSARSGEGGSQDPGCPPTACPITGSSPADLPLVHAQPLGSAGGGGAAAMTAASLARLHGQIAARAPVRELPALETAREDRVLSREIALGTGLLAFGGEGDRSSALGPKVGASLALSWPLGEALGLTVEPWVGGQALRSGEDLHTELAGEVRAALTGSAMGGRSRWQVASWQKGRFLSDPLPAPGYLEPGRAEGGMAGRLTVPLGSRWEMEAEGGAEGVRYEPEEWRVLDRQGINAALGTAWRGASRAARVSMRGSHHGFPHARAEGQADRADTRIGMEMDGSLEGRWVARLSVGGSWNDSRDPAYDFGSGRAALVVSAPWGKGSLQGYAALAHQVYLNPGPEEARVAPSDQDSGAVVSLQYALPLSPRRVLLIRGGWSRSRTGFRDDFYERFGMSVHLAFRGG